MNKKSKIFATVSLSHLSRYVLKNPKIILTYKGIIFPNRVKKIDKIGPQINFLQLYIIEALDVDTKRSNIPLVSLNFNVLL